MSDARYFHTSLYSFSTRARTEILTKVNSAVGNGRVKCWYDTGHDAFILECPTSLGIAAAADERLGAIIATYIQRELDAVDAEERPPEVKRFADATFIDLNQVPDVQVEQVSPQTIQARSHLIKVGEDEGKRIRFMSLHSLPDRLLQRTLAPNNEKLDKLFSNGLTCRAVRWDLRNGDVFNGRTGVGQTFVPAEELQLPDFHVLKDERSHDEDSETRIKTWAHVGDAPAVEKWVQGTGRTRQVEPDEQVDMPNDAKKFIARNPNTIGRTRVPKGKDLLSESSDDDDQTPPNDDAGKDSAVMFNALLAGNRIDAETDDDESGSEQESNSSNAELRKTFNDLVKKGPGSGAMQLPKRTTSGDWDTVLPPKSTTSQSTILPSEPPPPSKPDPSPQASSRASSRAATPASSQPLEDRSNGSRQAKDTSVENAFPEYGGRFAKVDNIGLTASAANTAQWEGENYVHRSPKKKSQRIVASGRQTTTTSRAPSLASFNTQATARQDLREADWVNKPFLGGSQPGPKLVDDTAAATSGPVAVPPGLTYSPAEAEPTPQQSKEKDDVINERVKELPPSYAAKRNTMRQKAGRKGKGKKVLSRPPQPKAQLPLPDPPPPPKGKQKEKVSTPTQVQSTSKGIDGQGVSGKTAQLSQSNSDPASMENPSHAFGQFLLAQKRAATEQHDEEEENEGTSIDGRLKLVASIGTLLTRPSGKEFNRGVLSPVAHQTQLNASADPVRTDFVNRLTTSKEDAAHMLGLGGDDVESLSMETVYEIWVRDAGGTQLTLEVPPQRKLDYTLRLHDRVVAEAYAHYPTHVWDALFALVKPGADQVSPSEDAIKLFVSSMETDGEAPSFKAMEITGLLVVQKILAKRVFTKQVGGGTLRVTQVQDMLVDSMSDTRHSLRAVAQSYFEMVHDHRLWWEARWEADDLENAGLLEEKVNEMVAAIDAVGLDNQGPYSLGEAVTDEEHGEAEFIPFW